MGHIKISLNLKKLSGILLTSLILFSLIAIFSVQATTNNFTASTGDGTIESSHATYSTAVSGGSLSVSTSGNLAVGQLYYESTYTVQRSYLLFNTSTISVNAIISSATLSLYGAQDFSITNFNVVLQKWTGSEPLTTAQWNSEDGTSYGSTFSTSSLITNGYNNITISNLNLITKNGYTQIALVGSREGTQPSGEEWVAFYSANDATRKPFLTITYTTSNPPTYSNLAHNNTLVNTEALFSSYWEDNDDDVGLSHYIFSTNNTGSWINDTAIAFSGTPAWANVSKTLNNTPGLIVGYKWYANDTANNWNSTSIQTLIISELELPTYSIIGNIGAIGGATGEFYLYANDNVELGTYIFSYKIDEGSYTNLTGTSFASTPGWANLSRTLPTQNATFYFKYYFSDSFGNWNTTSEESFAVTYISAPTPTATPTATPTPTPTGTPAPTPPLYVGDTSNLYFRSDTYTTLNVSAYGLDSDFTDTQVTSNTASDIDLVQYGIRVYLVSSDLQKTELTNTVSAIITLTHNSTGNVTGLVYGSWIIPSKPVILGYQALQVDIYSYTPNSLWTLEKSFISPVLITKEIYSTQLTFALYVNTTFITPSTLGGVSDFNSTFIFGSPDYKSGLYGLAMSVPLQSEIQLWRLTSGDYVGFEIGAYYDLIGGAFYVLLLLLAAGILYFRYGHFGTVAFFFVTFGGLGGLVWIFVPPWAAAVVSAFVILGISFIVWRLIR